MAKKNPHAVAARRDGQNCLTKNAGSDAKSDPGALAKKKSELGLSRT